MKTRPLTEPRRLKKPRTLTAARTLPRVNLLSKALAFTPALALALLAAAAPHTCRAQTPPQVVVVPGDEARRQPQPAAQQTQQPNGARDSRTRERGSGTIKGRVVGESGEPLTGVSVSVSPRGGTQFFRPQRTLSDEEGNFTLTGLDPGLYSVSANLAGYVVEADPSSNRPPAYRPGDTALLRLVKGGVITGTVTDAQGEPVVAISVRAFRVRDIEGRPSYSTGFNFGSEDNTDDRGVYRIYGLQPGVYIVSAGSSGRGFFFGAASAYEGNVTTFYPSATRDTASEVTVRSGQENAGVDIRYRDEQGRAVTGRLEFPAGVQPEPGLGVSVTLSYAPSGGIASSTFVPYSSGAAGSFSFEGVADGEYDVQASAAGREGPQGASPPQRVSVRGADVTGLKLSLAPLSSVSGTLSIDQLPEAERARETCKGRSASMTFQETLVALTADRAARGQAQSRMTLVRDVLPDASGAFTLRALEPGRYRIAARPADELLYVRSIQLPAPTPARANSQTGRAAQGARGAAPQQGGAGQAARDSLDVRAGQQLSGVSVRLAEGAAFLSGRLTVAEGVPAPPFAQMRVHLLPAEREGADDTLRYFEAAPDGSGAFTFRNVPPGRYLAVARPLTEPGDGTPPRPAHWDAATRTQLRREAEAADAALELQPCQRTTDFTLRFPK